MEFMTQILVYVSYRLIDQFKSICKAWLFECF